MMMLERFQLFEPAKDLQSLDEALALSAFGKGLEAEYEAHGLKVPAWLSNGLASLHTEIKVRVRDKKMAALTRAKSRVEALRPDSEKLTDARALVAKLEEELAD